MGRLDGADFNRLLQLPAPVRETAWRKTANATVALDENNEVAVVRGGIRTVCPSAGGIPLSVGFDGVGAYWSEWTEDSVEGTSRLYRSAADCSSPTALASISGQLTTPAFFAGAVFAVSSAITRVSRLVRLVPGQVPQVVVGVAQPIATCATDRGLLVVQPDGLVLIDESLAVALVTTWGQEPTAYDCDGESILVAVPGSTSTALWQYDANSGALSVNEVAGVVTAVGLSEGGWYSVDRLARVLGSGKIVVSSVPVGVEDVWSSSGQTMLRERGGALLARLAAGDWAQMGWNENSEFVDMMSTVSIGQGALLRASLKENVYSVVEVLGEDVALVWTMPRSNIFGTDDTLRLRSWSIDECSGDVLVGLQVGVHHWLLSRNQRTWTVEAIPVSQYLSAQHDPEYVSVLIDNSQTLIRATDSLDWRSLDGAVVLGEGAYWKIDVPLSRRVLSIDGAMIAESLGEVLHLRPSLPPRVLGVGRLMGVANGWVTIGGESLQAVRIGTE